MQQLVPSASEQAQWATWSMARRILQVLQAGGTVTGVEAGPSSFADGEDAGSKGT
jgi:hypothetical protein